MIETRKRLSIFDILIFLGFFDLFGRGVYVLAVAGVVGLIYSKRKSESVGKVTIWLILFAFSYITWIFATEGLNIRAMIFPAVSILLFFAGRNCVKSNNGISSFKKYTLIVALGAATYGLANMLLNVRSLGWDFQDLRILKDIWNSEDTLATGQSALFVPIVGTIYYVFVYLKKDRSIWWTILMATVVILGIVYNIMTASRYILFVSFLILVASFIIDVSTKKKNGIQFFVKSMAVIIVVVTIYQLNLFGIKTFWENSSLMERMTNLEKLNGGGAFSSEARVEQIRDIINNFSLYIGGEKPTGYPFIHNAWLSLLNYGGLFLLIPFLVLTIYGLALVIRVAKNNRGSTRVLVIGVFVSIYGFFMIEPLFEGARWLFLAYTFFLGMLDSIKHVKDSNV